MEHDSDFFKDISISWEEDDGLFHVVCHTCEMELAQLVNPTRLDAVMLAAHLHMDGNLVEEE